MAKFTLLFITPEESDSPRTFMAFAAGPKPIERCRALYDFEPSDVPNGISIKAGDVITVLNKTPSGWWEGELRGQTGFFPSNYVQPM